MSSKNPDILPVCLLAFKRPVQPGLYHLYFRGCLNAQVLDHGAFLADGNGSLLFKSDVLPCKLCLADEGMTSRHTDNSEKNFLIDCHLMRQLVKYFGQSKLWLTKASYTGPHAINSTLSRGPANLFPDEQTYTDYCCAFKRHGPASQSLSVKMSSSPYLPHGSRAANVPLHRQPNRRGSPDSMLCKRRASPVNRS